MNTSNMKQQNIIIIGATSGIGKALFEKYAETANASALLADGHIWLTNCGKSIPTRPSSPVRSGDSDLQKRSIHK